MNFDLHLYGETPEELLSVLAHLGHMDSSYTDVWQRLNKLKDEVDANASN